MPAKSGKQLCVKDIMTTNPVCAGMSISVPELAELLEANDISGVPVLDTRDRLVGVVSKTDLIHRCVEGPVGGHGGSFFSSLAEGLAVGSAMDPGDLGVVEDFMSADPVTATPDEEIASVAHRMADERVHRVIVVGDSKQVIGIVTTLDLLKVFPD